MRNNVQISTELANALEQELSRECRKLAVDANEQAYRRISKLRSDLTDRIKAVGEILCIPCGKSINEADAKQWYTAYGHIAQCCNECAKRVVFEYRGQPVYG